MRAVPWYQQQLLRFLFFPNALLGLVQLERLHIAAGFQETNNENLFAMNHKRICSAQDGMCSRF